MSFFDRLFSFLHKPQPAPAQNNTPAQNATRNSIPRNAAPKPNKNVYDEAFKAEVPEWAQGLNNTELTAQIPAHVKCHYTPNFGWKKIMTANMGPDGNLIPEYDGIAGDCGAVKSYGLKVAQKHGRTMPYKYVDLNMAFRCCCDIPTKCPFLQMAQNEASAVNMRRR